MKTISVRDFQIKASAYIDNLPITLTRYNKPVAMVVPYSVEGAVQKLQESTPLTKEAIPNISVGWCEGHFEKGVEYNRRLVTAEDLNGNTVLLKKWICDKCIEKLETNVRQYGGKVFYL